MSLTFEPLISPVLWVTLAVLTIATLAMYGWRRPEGFDRGRWRLVVGLTTAGTLAVLFVLLNPTWIAPIPPPAGKPLMTVLVDVSASMATEDVPDGGTRLRHAANVAHNLSEELADRFDVRVRSFAAQSNLTDPASLKTATPDGGRSDLAAAIAGSLDGDRPQGQAVVLLSDGVHNGSGGMRELLDTARTAHAMSVPIYTRTIGEDTIRNDIDIALQRPQELAFAGQKVPIAVNVRQRGLLSDRAEIVLLHRGKEVGRERADLRANESSTVQFQVRQNKSGLYRYDVRTDALPGEATNANNSSTLLVRVIEKPIRVLVLEGKPYWDTKFLVRTLAADPSLELDSVVRLRAGRYVQRSLRVQRSDPSNGDEATSTDITRTESTEFFADAAPILRDDGGLGEYQVIVLGRDAETYLSDAVLEDLRTWISRDGGSLVCFRGSPVAQVTQALSRLMPVRWTPVSESRFRMQMTPRGRALNWLTAIGTTGSEDVLTKLPSLSTAAQPQQPKPLAVVLATSNAEEGPAAVTYQPYGTGRVVAIEGSGMWRWAFLAPQYQSHDSVYASLWQSLLRWLVSGVGLAPGQDVALRTDKVSFSTTESPSAILLLREEAGREVPQVELKHEDGTRIKTQTPVPLGDEPGVYRIGFGSLDEGRYTAAVVDDDLGDASTASVAFDVREDYSEQLDVAARPDIMRRIARDSGGEPLDGEGSATVAEKFQEHMARSRPLRVQRMPAWDRWWVLLFIIAAWSAAWALRRSGGLV